MNLPNKLSLLRVALIPVMVALMLPQTLVCDLLAAAVLGRRSRTETRRRLSGRIARTVDGNGGAAVEAGKAQALMERLGRLARRLGGRDPARLTGLRLSLIYAWMGTLGAEYFMPSDGGIGSLMIGAQQLLRMDLIMSGMLLVGLQRGAAGHEDLDALEDAERRILVKLLSQFVVDFFHVR